MPCSQQKGRVPSGVKAGVMTRAWRSAKESHAFIGSDRTVHKDFAAHHKEQKKKTRTRSAAEASKKCAKKT